jgi:protein-export membrane protein SecD
MKEAKDLAIVLRAGALPAQLDFLEERVVGPSLGADSVASGAKAALIGSLVVFLFVSIYYRASGVLASISLILNLLFSFTVLVMMDATLTLPGIAGLALTIGMAVDSNVLIFERIRDELRDGKSIAGAVNAGFDRAFSAILDGNLTNGVTGVVLLMFGTGPVRGFAITLLVGVATTLFCAVTVCKMAYDGWLAMNDGNPKKISI